MSRLFALLIPIALTACAAAPKKRDLSWPDPSTAIVDQDRCGPSGHPPAGARASIQPLPFDLASVRVAVIPVSRPFMFGTNYSGPEATDLTVRILKASFRPATEPRPAELVPKSTFGKIEMGAVPATFECGSAVDRTVPLHYTTFIPHAGESAEIVVGDAVFNEGSCKATLVRRESILASPIAGGILYAIREAPSVGAPPDRLTFFLPIPLRVSGEGLDGDSSFEQIGGMTRITVPLGRGTGVSLVATFDTAVLDSWLSDGLEVDARAAHATYGATELTVGVEITQAVGDPVPVGLAYIEKTNTTRTFERARLFRCAEAAAAKR